MSSEEKQKFSRKYYAEAIRYMDNAKEMLQKAGGDFLAEIVKVSE